MLSLAKRLHVLVLIFKRSFMARYSGRSMGPFSGQRAFCYIPLPEGWFFSLAPDGLMGLCVLTYMSDPFVVVVEETHILGSVLTIYVPVSKKNIFPQLHLPT